MDELKYIIEQIKTNKKGISKQGIELLSEKLKKDNILKNIKKDSLEEDYIKKQELKKMNLEIETEINDFLKDGFDNLDEKIEIEKSNNLELFKQMDNIEKNCQKILNIQKNQKK